MKIAALFAACACLLTSVAHAEGDDPLGLTAVETKRYLVTTTHAPDQCLAALDEMAAKARKTLSKMQWGCEAGDHTGYMFVDAADQESALEGLPPSARARAKAIEVTRYTPRQLRAIHAKMSKGTAAPAAK